MPKLSHFVYCERILAIPSDPNPHLVKPLQVLTPRFIPSDYSFAIAFGVSGVDLSKENTAMIKFVSPNGDVLHSQSFKVSKPTEKVTLPPEVRGFMITIDFKNVPIREVGDHKTEVYLNEDLVADWHIYVVKGNDK